MSMLSAARRQAFIDAPLPVVWELLSDVTRHPEWWPKVIEVECEGLEEGCTYRAVMKGPVGKEDMTINVESLSECQDLLIRCVNTGTYVHMALTEARGGTFLDAEAGMEAKDLGHRIWDTVAGQRYFRSWMAQTLEALERVACAGAGEHTGA
jgi:uncharacterized protein YndB with AHSA1/START domain